jgi:hypothetical protein
VACGQNSQSANGSVGLTNCICNPGYTGPNGGTCEACATGKYKNTPGAGICTYCVEGKYYPTEASNCLDCGEGKYKATVPVAAVTCGGLCPQGCGGQGFTLVSDATSGTISDGPGYYINYATCWWLITTTQVVEIKLNFQSFSTENNFDFVNIYTCVEPTCVTTSHVVQATGSHSPANFYKSTTGYMKIILNTMFFFV